MTAEPDTAGPFFYAPQAPLRILFVDGDPILREFAVANLSGDEAEVETAADCDETLATIAAKRPDVVFLSLEGAGQETLTVLEALREHPRHGDIPIIVITGREDVEAVDAAFASGATAFAVKPLNWRLLGRQARFVHRAVAAGQRARAPDYDAAAERLAKLAREGVRFITHAMAIDPSLKAAAVPFADAADAALQALPGRGRG